MPGWETACCSSRKARPRSRSWTAGRPRWMRRWSESWTRSTSSSETLDDDMDDETIRKLTEEVLADLSRPAETDTPGLSDLEARVAALEATLREIGARSPATAAASAPP